jgi:hypothetical protein
MNQMRAIIQAIRMRIIGQSAARSKPMRPAPKTRPIPIPDPTYLKHPTQGAHILPKISPKHILEKCIKNV